MPETSPQIILVNRAIIRRGDALLFVQRSADDSHNADLWEAPGGKLDAGEELPAGIEREVYEETGLMVDKIPPFVYPISEVVQRGKYEGSTYVALFSLARVVSGEVRLSPEHSDHTWEHITDALDLGSRSKLVKTTETKRALCAFSGVLMSSIGIESLAEDETTQRFEDRLAKGPEATIYEDFQNASDAVAFINYCLSTVYRDGAHIHWWNARNKFLAGRIPLEVMAEDSQAVIDAAVRLATV